MSVGAKMLDRMSYLSQEGDTPPTHENPLTVALQEEHASVEAEVYAFDRLGVSLRGLTILGDNRDAGLEALAQTINQRVTYLSEPVALVERDLDREEVQMRSAPPLADDRAIEFYEGRLTRQDGSPHLHLVRYRQEHGEPRRVGMPITLTHNVFRRLVDDLAAILRAPATD